jgi:indolepyruvate ferredoxin oxidoreductase beta subunit
MTAAVRPITILIGALGGEGGGVLAEWLVETATAAGHLAQGTSIPGVAQRTGATTYYVEVFPADRAALAGRTPVLSLLPVPGGVDLVVASELLEAGRIVGNGYVSPDRTLLIASTSRTLTTAEKMALGNGRFDSDALLAVATAQSRRLVAFDLESVARATGTMVSAVMFGAIAASGVLSYRRDAFEHIVAESGRGADASLRGFAEAWEMTEALASAPGTAGTPPHGRPVGRSAAGIAPDVQTFGAQDAQASSAPPGRPSTAGGARANAIDLIALGRARVAEFQDERYAALYDRRVDRVAAAERVADPASAHGGVLTRETARFLALWMAFDDIVRVAGQKCRASRFARVRAEVAAKDGDIVRIVDHFKPGVPEFAALLPPALARRAIAWDRARQRRGKPPLAFALHLRSDGIGGLLALRLLASLKGMRRRGLRYADEQAAIERWLQAIERLAGTDWQCAYELVLCGRLVKGYGATNERGKQNLAHIVAHLADDGEFATPADRAVAIRQAREAALADEGGQAFDQALANHGAPARPVIAQPIRWMTRSATSTHSKIAS